MDKMERFFFFKFIFPLASANTPFYLTANEHIKLAKKQVKPWSCAYREHCWVSDVSQEISGLHSGFGKYALIIITANIN